MEFVKKAIPMVCLFLFPLLSYSQDFILDSKALAAYNDVLDLRPLPAIHSNNAGSAYVISFGEAIDLLLSEDQKKFSEYEARFESRTDATPKTPADMFVRAENHLQWAFVYLKFGHELDAALQLRKAYNVTRDLRKKHPQFKAALKTSGLLHIMLGSVPDKYNWILDLLDMRGNVDTGLKELGELASSKHFLSREAAILKGFVLGFVLQEPEDGLSTIQTLLINPDNATLFLAANLAMKNSNAEEGLKYIAHMKQRFNGIDIPYVHYLEGEMLLCKGNYDHAEKAFKQFLDTYAGENYVKDALFKIGVCRLLSDDKQGANAFFDQARSAGEETTEADKNAARSLTEDEALSVPLTKARYMTDGGYYQEAKKTLDGVLENDLSTLKDKIELAYRIARLSHKTGDLSAATTYYRKTITLSGNSDYYFAPNACLQLGYIFMGEGQNEEAATFFRKALSYKKHPYKNSIDSKAKSALNHLKERR